MKKKIILILIGGMLLLAGCGTPASKGEEGNAGSAVELEEAAEGKEEQDASAEGKGEEKSTDAGNAEEIADDDAAETSGESRYTWQEITITLPEDWVDRCVMVEGENGFSICQRASYEEDNTLGFICGFDRTAEPVEYGIGETMFAYTEDGILYYLVLPMDVDCNTENEAVTGEYLRMCGQIGELKASVEIAASGIHYDAEEYVLPTSSILPLRQDMLDMSDNDLWIARNEIYARHGRQFTNGYLQKYFNRCTWYEGTIPAEQFDESVLSQLEKENLKLLVAAEEEYDRWHPYPKKYSAAETALEDLSGDGTPNRIGYQVEERENGELECRITVDGVTYVVNELTYMDTPVMDVFYISDIVEDDGILEIAVLDEGPSNDPVTYFFRYDEELSYVGQVAGFPFAEENGGVNGFDGIGNIVGCVRMDLIETAYLEGYWRWDDWVSYQATAWHDMLPVDGHMLYEDLPVHYEMDETSETTIIPVQSEVFFLGSDMYEWILVKGKDGSKGYMQVADGMVVELDKAADQVFSDLYYFD